MSKRTIGLVLMMALASLPALSWADLPPPYGEVEGGFAEVTFGVNGLTTDEYVDGSDLDADVGPAVGLSFAGGWRPMDYLALDLLVHWAFLSADVEDADSDFSAFLAVMPEVRGHLPMGRFDPWIGFGLGYAMTYTRMEGDISLGFLGRVNYEGRIMLHGLGIGVSFGLDIWLTRNLAVSPFFRMVFGVWTKACLDTTVNGDHDEDCDDPNDLYDDNPWLGDGDDLPHLWIVGAGLTYSP